MSQEIHHLLYASKAQIDGLDDLTDILQRAKVNNATTGVTGALVYGNGHFLQVLEGGQQALNRLYHDRIVRDDRHDGISLLVFEPIQERLFGNWLMGLVKVEGPTNEILKQTTGKGIFEPTAMSAVQAKAFLLGIAHHKLSQGIVQ